ncbi:hypothetical protein Dip510_001886 [Elusimicrobium posterum]|uniref:hypothetical protein n=1 Tax=Elusimicrobium posterum TaxID=3116653 RepID=UPI003C741EB3
MKKILSAVLLCACTAAYAATHEDHDHDHNNSNNILNNINIAVIGSIVTSYTDDAHDEDRYKPAFNLGEIELFLEADINDYAEGAVVLGIHDDEHNHGEDDTDGHDSTSIEIEEAYINIHKNLPVENLGLKAGKYRVGFGRLNKEHEHALPFIDKPRVIAQFLPGEEEGYKDTGFNLYYTLPYGYENKTVFSFDILTGKEFHEDDDTKTKYAYIARINNSFMLGDHLPLEVGFTWMQSTANVEFGERTQTYGADIRTQLHLTRSIDLVLQGEVFYSNGTAVEYVTNVNPALPDDAYFHSNSRYGYYLMADAHLGEKWNLGVIYDEYQRYLDKDNTDRAAKIFVGWKVWDFITLRASYERQFLKGEEDVNTAAVQVLFSIGGHREHK